MTKKDFVRIARGLSTAYDSAQNNEQRCGVMLAIKALSAECKEDNPNFKDSAFMDAVAKE